MTIAGKVATTNLVLFAIFFLLEHVFDVSYVDLISGIVLFCLTFPLNLLYVLLFPMSRDPAHVQVGRFALMVIGNAYLWGALVTLLLRKSRSLRR
jgi:hypothetical protein